MNIKSLLLGSAAALVAVTGARAADAVVVAEPEPVEYVRVCDAYGKGFFYIPGTETCLKVSGYVRYDAKAGDDPYTGVDRETWSKGARADLRFDARSETELGTLRSYTELRFNFKNGADAETVDLNNAYITLGGFLVGQTDSNFTSWTGYLGDIISDDVIQEGNYNTNQISYTFTGGNGFSAIIALEQGSGDVSTVDLESGEAVYTVSHVIDDYTPHIVAGAKFEQGWGSISAVAGYDSVSEEFAGKLRADVKFSDTISAWVMGGYQSDWDKTVAVDDGGRAFTGNYFAPWYGDWAIWGGVAIKASDKATINAQLAYEDDGTFAAALNVGYELVPGFKITPEINYTKFDGNRGDVVEAKGGGDDALQGIIRFQRNF